MGGKLQRQARGKPCPYCTLPMQKGKRRPTKDHLLPRARGGDLNNGNAVICCAKCNHDKKDYTLVEWLERLRKGRDPRAIIVENFMEDYKYKLPLGFAQRFYGVECQQEAQ